MSVGISTTATTTESYVILTVKPADILHRDLAVSPHSGYDRMQFPAFKAPERDPEVLAVHDEG